MSGKARILVLSGFPSEGERIAQTIGTLSDCPVQAITDPSIALGMIGADGPEIIFAHAQEGTETATRFLDDVWTRHPQTTRFLLADSTRDCDALVNCALGPHQFIPGPLDSEKLNTALHRADAIKNLVANEKIRDLVSRMRTLPNRPALSLEIMRELRSARASASMVGEMVAKDLAISTKLIQIANSAFFSPEQQVSNPVEAVLLIGLETTAALVLSIETFAQADKLKPLYFSMDRVWKHSQAVADLGRRISQTLGHDAEATAHVYTAGLLHDLGKLALALNFDEDYERILNDAEDKAVPVYQIEQEFFGVTHAETGAYLLALWGMPLPIVEAVASHHLPVQKLRTESPVVTALHLADQLVNAPHRLDEILAEYRSDVRVWRRLESLKALFGNQKDRPAKPRKTKSTAPRTDGSNPSPESAKTPDEGPKKRTIFYLAVTAAAGLIGLAGFFLWPRTALLAEPRAQLETKASAGESPQAPVLAKVDQGANDKNAVPPESNPLLTPPDPRDQLFPFDHLFPIEESSVLEYPAAASNDGIIPVETPSE